MGSNVGLGGGTNARLRRHGSVITQPLSVITQPLSVITGPRPGDLSPHVTHQMAGSGPGHDVEGPVTTRRLAAMAS
jgi:hypothetical protein